MDRNILLLIGITGSGKSTFGNYIANEKKFATAKDNYPETSKCSTADFMHDGKLYTVIDSPGLNESDLDDFKHIHSIFLELQSHKKIKGLLFCIKYDEKLVENMINCIKSYAYLFHQLFTNCSWAIIITNVNQETIKNNSINIMECEKNIKKEFYNIVKSDVKSFLVDSKNNKDYSNKKNQIMNYVDSFTGIMTNLLFIKKSDSVMKSDTKIILRFNKEIKDLELCYDKKNELVNRIKCEIMQNNKNIEENSDRLKFLDAEVQNMDSNKQIIFNSESYSKPNGVLWSEITITYNSKFPIHNVKTNEKNINISEMKKVDDMKKITFTLKSGWFGDLKVKIDYITVEKEFYKEKIQSHKDKIERIESQLKMLKDIVQEKQKIMEKYLIDLKNLRIETDTLKKNIQYFSCPQIKIGNIGEYYNKKKSYIL